MKIEKIDNFNPREYIETYQIRKIDKIYNMEKLKNILNPEKILFDGEYYYILTRRQNEECFMYYDEKYYTTKSLLQEYVDFTKVGAEIIDTYSKGWGGDTILVVEIHVKNREYPKNFSRGGLFYTKTKELLKNCGFECIEIDKDTYYTYEYRTRLPVKVYQECEEYQLKEKIKIDLGNLIKILKYLRVEVIE